MIHFDLEGKKLKIEELNKLTEADDFWKDQKKSKKVINEINKNKRIIESYSNISFKVASISEELLSEDLSTDFEMFELISEEFDNIVDEFSKFEIETLLTGTYDQNNVILEFHSGAGGTEAQDWANMLFNMYLRYAENKGLKSEVLDYQEGNEAGIKSASIYISGDNAYGYLKGEAGVHRLVRISPFDSNKSRHTSFASVDVIPEMEELDNEIQIQESDLRIDTYRSSGAGGQHINKTDSAVRLTHIPSGIVVNCQSQRSQIQNKEKAMLMLKAKLYQKMQLEKQAEISGIRGEQKLIEWGSQVRSYVFCPYLLVKDHRSNYETSDVENVMDGDIDDIIYSLLKMDVEK